MSEPGDQLQANTVVAHRYRVIGYRGDRGFGQVYRVEDLAMSADMALMRLDREFSHPRVRESFFETRSTAQVEDPRVVDITDYGEDFDGRLFLVMPWIEDAHALDELVARDRVLAWPRIKAIIEQIAAALDAAHKKGVLHGGLEPSRVLVDADDNIHIVDFGLAPALTRPGGQPVTNVSPLGRSVYLSPEVIRGEAVDARSDIYALGVVLWELVAGSPPFVGNPAEVASAHLEQSLPELPRRDAPVEIEPLLHLALTKDKEERLASAEEFSMLLNGMPGGSAPVQAGRPTLARTPTVRVGKRAATPAAQRSPAAAAQQPPPRHHQAPARQPPPRQAAAQPAQQPPPRHHPAAATPRPPATPVPTLPSASTPIASEPTAAVPRPIGAEVDHPPPPRRAITPPPKRRRLGKLEWAIILFVGFDILLFTAWRLFFSSAGAGTAAADDQVAASDVVSEAEPSEAAPAEPQPAREPEPVAPDPKPDKPVRSVHEAIASELPPEPENPGPTRPIDDKLNEKDFREAMTIARDDIVERCLDTRMRRTIKVSAKVRPNGDVEYARVHGSQAETTLGRCVVKRLYRVEFPATREGGSHTYSMRLR